MRPLEFIFQDSDIARALDFLILFREFDYTYSEFIKKCGLRSELKAQWIFKHLVEIGLIITNIDKNGFYDKYYLNKIMAKPLIDLHENYIDWNKKRLSGS